jgi:hypothetical protein
MNRRAENETLTLLREIRDLVQLLVIRETSAVEKLQALADSSAESSRHACSWSSIHGPSRTERP